MSEQDVRTRIMDEATRLFGEKGYGETSIRDVARASDVANPTIYYHFKNKEGLYLETVRHHVEAAHELFTVVVNRDAPVLDRIRDFYKVQIEGISENPAAARLLFYANHRPESGEPQVDMMTMHQRSQSLHERLRLDGIAEGVFRPDIDELDFTIALIGPTFLAGWATLNDV
ncbi:MAG: TetR/AcrR family transcriptional regulator, partial [Proteobacteria bacterium]|nr:TetR/AcrR family transcriptional regulator [Pseudomonadota bacterium]